MKQKNMYSFFLEIIFSLILLTIATVTALLLFTNAAKIDKDNRALSQITEEMVVLSETLRAQDDAYMTKFEAATETEKAYFYGYDAQGKVSSVSVVYQLAVYIKNETKSNVTLRKSRLELIDLRASKVLVAWKVSTLCEGKP
jgi:hypothetical protein